MAHEKQYTAKQAASAVLDKVSEILRKSAVAKNDLNKAEKRPAQEDTTKEKPAAPASPNDDQNAENEHAAGQAPKGEIHPKEHVEGASDAVRQQKDPQHNVDEQKEGNNELAGTTPTQVGQDGKNKPGYDEMKGHLKLAKFIGWKEHKRTGGKI